MNIVETDGRKDALKKRIREKIDELRNYEAKVGVFGVTGWVNRLYVMLCLVQMPQK